MYPEQLAVKVDCFVTVTAWLPVGAVEMTPEGPEMLQEQPAPADQEMVVWLPLVTRSGVAVIDTEDGEQAAPTETVVQLADGLPVPEAETFMRAFPSLGKVQVRELPEPVQT